MHFQTCHALSLNFSTKSFFLYTLRFLKFSSENIYTHFKTDNFANYSATIPNFFFIKFLFFAIFFWKLTVRDRNKRRIEKNLESIVKHQKEKRHEVNE